MGLGLDALGSGSSLENLIKAWLEFLAVWCIQHERAQGCLITWAEQSMNVPSYGMSYKQGGYTLYLLLDDMIFSLGRIMQLT